MATYFISDLHLSPERPEITAAFERFLNNEAQDAKKLYILGDFFDAWVGDDDNDAFARQLKTLLSSISQRGVEVFFIRGNRDFMIGEALANACRFTLLEDETVIELYGKRVLVMHGDTLCTADVEYQQFRKMVRNPVWQQQVLALPLNQRRAMAADLRSKSQSMNAMKAEDIMDVTLSEVATIMDEYRVKTLIHGHTHRPAHHQFEEKGKPHSRWVLGDWHNNTHYLRADENGFELKELTLTR
ncbi:UDP-2,3-diacylglucosamine diphosphatase [Marinagarivorans algicola]|uniref:UDP-2,3-diacylglucosamine diphosphatase n=1 Tax=Marinagarivorans algicola TaxID=1513270 RepID=UPI0006B9D54D|nr:UDP-2,3-diacylglucosamine diphosphatase [Marinagarivorans algicola]